MYKTADLIEASILSMHGLSPSLENGERGQAIFVFELEDGAREHLLSVLSDLKRSKLKVEPKRFAREMKHVRESLYDFLNVDRDTRRLSRGR